jgi:hypothetical protein
MKGAFIFLLVISWLRGSEQAIFRKEGRLHLSSGTVAVRMTANLATFAAHCEELLAAVNSTTPAHTDLKAMHHQLATITREACDRVASWPGAIEPAPQRGRRFLGAVAGAVFGAVADELWHSASDETRHLEKRLEGLTKNFAALLVQVKAMASEQQGLRTSLHHLKVQLELATAVLNNARLLDTLSEGISTVITQGRVSSALLPLEFLSPMWKSVARTLRGQSIAILPLPAHSVYECPVTYRFERNHLHILIQIPVVTHTFTLWHKSSQPTWIPHLDHPVILDPGFIAVAPDGRTFVLPPSNLAGCRTVGGEPVCPLEVALSDWGNHCLSALYQSLWSEALGTCEMQRFKGLWAAQRVDGSTFEVILTIRLAYKQVCPGTGRQSRVQGQWEPGRHIITINAGCRVETTAFTLFPAWQGELTSTFRPAIEWMSTNDIFKALKERESADDAQGHDVVEGIKKIEGQITWEVEPMKAASVGGITICIIVATAIAVTLCVYRRCKKKQPGVDHPAES